MDLFELPLSLKEKVSGEGSKTELPKITKIGPKPDTSPYPLIHLILQNDG